MEVTHSAEADSNLTVQEIVRLKRNTIHYSVLKRTPLDPTSQYLSTSF
jgi:hypothetical protein